jgi:hypothetical protein
MNQYLQLFLLCTYIITASLQNDSLKYNLITPMRQIWKETRILNLTQKVQ